MRAGRRQGSGEGCSWWCRAKCWTHITASPASSGAVSRGREGGGGVGVALKDRIFTFLFLLM